ncbi:mechanosensitive ion channel [Candidatus Micrarchaeota archaeon]|nr:mechanosensitive ion channel [Candidatus Micrarchaeota archaeon]
MGFLDSIIQPDAPVPALIGAAIILIIGFVVGKMVKQFVLQLAEATGIRQKVRFGIDREAKKFGFNLDFVYLAALVFKYVVFLIAIFIALRILSVEVGMSTVLIPLISYIPNIVSAIIILIIGSAIIEIIADVLKYNLRDRLDEKAKTAGMTNVSTNIASYVRYFLYLVVFITAFLQLGIKVESLMLLVLSIGIIALGTLAVLFIFSLKDHVSGISYGIHLVNNKVIVKGDILQIGDLRGEVVEITLLATVIKNKESIYHIPNSKIAQSIFSINKK